MKPRRRQVFGVCFLRELCYDTGRKKTEGSDMIDLQIRKEQLEHNIALAREQGIVLPNLAQIRTPDLIPQALRKQPMFGMGWYEMEQAGFAAPRFEEIAPEDSGVPCRILALRGDAREGAEFGCRLAGFVTGQGTLTDAVDPDTDLRAALWHYNITGWALCDLFETQKRAGDRLFGVCLGTAEGGLSAAGDLIKARYPRAKLAVGGETLPAVCNVRNLDVRCSGSDPIGCCAAVATYFELDEHDVLLTVLPETASAACCEAKELTYPERKALFASLQLPEERRNEAFWAELYDQVIGLDIRINEFNDAV